MSSFLSYLGATHERVAGISGCACFCDTETYPGLKSRARAQPSPLAGRRQSRSVHHQLSPVMPLPGPSGIVVSEGRPVGLAAPAWLGS